MKILVGAVHANSPPRPAGSGALLLLVGVLAGCSGSVQAKANTSGDASAKAELSDPEDPFGDMSERSAERAQPAQQPPPEQPLAEPAELALMGARHDVYLRAKQAEVCSCLAVVAGPANDSRLVWESAVPEIDPQNQLVVAFSSHDQSCKERKDDSRQAAYRGYARSGNDVIVMIEEAKFGRPAITGAIVPRPLEGGHLFVQPADSELPFGKSKQAEGLCEVADIPPALPAGGVDLGAIEEPEPPTEAEDSEQPDLGPNLIGDLSKDPIEDEPDPENFDEYDDDEHSKRDGVYFGVVGGAGYARMDFPVGAGVPDAPLTSIPINVDVMIGGSPVPDLAIGAILGGASGSEPTMEVTLPAGTGMTAEQALMGSGFDVQGNTVTLTDTRLNIVRLGVFADYYLIEDSNLHVLAEVGYLSAFFSGGNGSSDDLRGPGFGLGLGYDFWLSHSWSLGLLARGTFAPLTASNIDFSTNLIYPVLLANLTYH